ncbi:MAG: tRNA pseudouridine(55) synthase TruB [Acholeplasmataceae bacterium]|jgi:tRNA pseudouridine55 synthase|nr:tRNA pseudouridine(55) synthase TruB [Acholeplasmataceae bacterium]
MDGILFINKPVGITSHDVVYKIKRKLNLVKLGHTGTLDPFASGLMILCVGKATKLQSLFLNLDKVYEGTIQFGHHYDTYDYTGTIVESTYHKVTEEEIQKKIREFNKTYLQRPPMYSARKHEGRKLYHLAREGKEVIVEPREVHIYDFKMTSSLNDQTFDFRAHVSKGTYIRSLAVDLAESLSTYGALTRLNRISIGNYHLDNAKMISDVLESDIISLDQFLAGSPSITLSEYMCNLVKNGVYLDERQTTIKENFIVKDELGNMIAYYEYIGENTYRPLVIL